MFNIFFKKQTKNQEFTSHARLHEAIERKMSEMVAGDVMSALNIHSLKEINNGTTRYKSLTNEQLSQMTRQMQRADLIMIKAAAEMTRKCNNGDVVVFDDNTIYTIIQNAQGLINPKELNAFKDRESMIAYINKKAELVLRMENNMLRFFTDFAHDNNQPVVVHG